MKRIISLGAGLIFTAALTVQASAFEKQKIITFSDEMTFEQRKTSVEEMGGTVLKDLEIINAVVATFPEVKMMRIERFQAQSGSSLAGIEAIEDDAYRNWIQDDPVSIPDIDLPTIAEILSSARSSETPVPAPAEPTEVEASGIISAAYNYLKGKFGAEVEWGVARVNAPNAWKYTQGSGIKVGIIDTGIDLDHTDLSVAGGFNALDSAKNADDDSGHGTHVAGIIAAIKDNGGVVGVAPKAKLYAVKVLDGTGGGTASQIIDGIQWCIKNKMKVINMSLGAPVNVAALKKAIVQAHKAGIVIVCATGNSGKSVTYPAAYKETIAVSASDSRDKLWYKSCRGPEVDFIAPGVSIYSTFKGGGYQTHSGTSMACPHVAGLAALAIARGNSGFAAVKKALAAAATQLDDLTQNQQGLGMIDALKVVK